MAFLDLMRHMEIEDFQGYLTLRFVLLVGDVLRILSEIGCLSCPNKIFRSCFLIYLNLLEKVAFKVRMDYYFSIFSRVFMMLETERLKRSFRCSSSSGKSLSRRLIIPRI